MVKYLEYVKSHRKLIGTAALALSLAFILKGHWGMGYGCLAVSWAVLVVT